MIYIMILNHYNDLYNDFTSVLCVYKCQQSWKISSVLSIDNA